MIWARVGAGKGGGHWGSAAHAVVGFKGAAGVAARHGDRSGNMGRQMKSMGLLYKC